MRSPYRAMERGQCKAAARTENLPAFLQLKGGQVTE